MRLGVLLHEAFPSLCFGIVTAPEQQAVSCRSVSLHCCCRWHSFPSAPLPWDVQLRGFSVNSFEALKFEDPGCESLNSPCWL